MEREGEKKGGSGHVPVKVKEQPEGVRPFLLPYEL